MIFSPENVQDIQRYYQKTFIKLEEFGDKLFFIDHVDRYEVKGKMEDGRNFVMYISEESPYTVDYILPHKSFFQMGENAVLLERIPAKQYHRGLCSENTTMKYVSMPEAKVGAVEISFNSLKCFVNKQKFFTLSAALAEKKTKSCVLNTRMMCVPSSRSIFIDLTEVAKVDGNKIQMIKSIFKHEVMQMLHAMNEQQLFTVV